MYCGHFLLKQRALFEQQKCQVPEGGGTENRTNMFCRSALLWLRADTCRGTPSHFPSNLFHLLCLKNSRSKFLNNRPTMHLRLRAILTHFVVHLSLSNYTWIFETRGFRSGEAEDWRLMTYKVAQIRKEAPTFRSNLLPPSSGQSERSEPLTIIGTLKRELRFPQNKLMQLTPTHPIFIVRFILIV